MKLRPHRGQHKPVPLQVRAWDQFIDIGLLGCAVPASDIQMLATRYRIAWLIFKPVL